MRASAPLLIALSAAVMASAMPPTAAEAAPQRSRPHASHKAAPRPLDFSAHGPSVAMQAARATQAATLPGAPAPGAAKPVEAPTSAPADTVSGLTVSPLTQKPGKVIASTDATSLTSPNFSVADAAKKPMAIAIGDNTALGKQTVDNTPVMAGLSHNNPDILGSQPTRGDVGVTTVF